MSQKEDGIESANHFNVLFVSFCANFIVSPCRSTKHLLCFTKETKSRDQFPLLSHCFNKVPVCIVESFLCTDILSPGYSRWTISQPLSCGTMTKWALSLKNKHKLFLITPASEHSGHRLTPSESRAKQIVVFVRQLVLTNRRLISTDVMDAWRLRCQRHNRSARLPLKASQMFFCVAVAAIRRSLAFLADSSRLK